MFDKLKKIFKKDDSEPILLRIAGISYSKVANIYVLILEETLKDSSDKSLIGRKVPIIMNFFEAQVIALELEKIRPSVQIIHDFIKELSFAFKFKFKKIIIHDLTENEVFTKLVCDNKQKSEIDIKPSDAMALSLRLKIPIYIDNKLLTIIDEMLNSKYDVKRMSEMEKLENYSVSDLEKILKEAIEKEDYENASLIRDEITRKSNT